MRRTKQAAAETRTNIIAAALPLFSSKGVAGTSLVEVAARAGVTRGAVYWHFKNKWDLLDALIEHYGEPIDRMGAASINKSEPDPLGKLAELLRFIFIATATREEYRSLFLLCSRTFHAQMNGSLEDQKTRQRFQTLIKQKQAQRCQMLRNAIDKGQLPANLDIDAAAALIRAMIEGIVYNWITEPDSYDLAARADQLVEAIIGPLKQGLIPARGES